MAGGRVGFPGRAARRRCEECGGIVERRRYRDAQVAESQDDAVHSVEAAGGRALESRAKQRPLIALMPEMKKRPVLARLPIRHPISIGAAGVRLIEVAHGGIPAAPSEGCQSAEAKGIARLLQPELDRVRPTPIRSVLHGGCLIVVPVLSDDFSHRVHQDEVDILCVVVSGAEEDVVLPCR